MTTGTGIRGTLKHPFDMAAFASRVGVDTRQGESGLVMIKSYARPSPFRSHERRREH